MEPNPDYNPEPGSGQITPDRFKSQFPNYENPYKTKGSEDRNFYDKKKDFPGGLGSKDLGHNIELNNPRLEDNPDPEKEHKAKMNENVELPKKMNPDLEFDPEKNSKSDRVASELNKNDPQYSFGQEQVTYHDRNKNYPPFLGRKQRQHQVPINDLGE